MKKSTMQKLCIASDEVKRAADLGFDFPPIREGLDAAKQGIASDHGTNVRELRERILPIIERLELEDLANLVDWIFRPGSIDPDALVQEMAHHYGLWAEMFIDEETVEICSRLLQECQELRDGLHRHQDITQVKIAEADLASKLERLQELSGSTVEVNEDGILEYVEEDNEICSRLLQECQELRDGLYRHQSQTDLTPNELASLLSASLVDLASKLKRLEELGNPVYLKEGVFLFVPEDDDV